LTFLFTDIEGSTSRWESQHDAMAAALARHDALLRSAIEDHGGRVFKTVGDAFYAAFDEPADALAGAHEQGKNKLMRPHLCFANEVTQWLSAAQAPHPMNGKGHPPEL
jgi:class 3 adenylate cyclase